MKRILLIEDNPGDRDLIRETLKNEKAIALDTVEDGMQAMEFLSRKGDYAEAKRPDLIILDLNLPRKDGREVLTEIKSDENLKTVPVIILTTSKAESDIKTCYKLHANSFFIKPNRFQEFVEIIDKIKSYWLTHVVLSPI